MKDMNENKRIGFVLRSIHFGSSLKLWFKLSDYTLNKNGAFFIFPGGVVNGKKSSEKFRNPVYRLVNSENLDGIISWSSSIKSDDVPESEIENFHTKFGDIPFVTIGDKIKNAPNVSFDAYTGMKELVLHFIKVHDAKRIAFIRGPEHHASSSDRFNGFKDALIESGLYTEEAEKLITDCFDWDEGEKAIEQLYEERKLIPGKSFDTLIASSDLMAFAAVNWLEKRGFFVPKDFLLGGFNDSEESRICHSQITTVSTFIDKLGISAYDKLTEIMNGKSSDKDVVLPSVPIIKESCGCNSMKQLISFQEKKKRAKTRDQLLSEFVALFNAGEKEREEILVPLFDVLFENNQAEFFRLLGRALRRYFENDGELKNLFTAVKILANSTCLPSEYVDKIIHSVSFMIPKIQEQVFVSKLYAYEKAMAAISALKTDLLSVHDRNSFMNVLAEHFPKIGIRKVTIILYENEEFSRYFGSFNDTGEINVEEVLFPSKLLVPAKFAGEFKYGTYVVQPLFLKEKSLGYIITPYVSGCNGNIYEDFRASISNAIQSIFMFEEIQKAKQTAERAEFAKTEFFSNVGKDLCDPLRNISAKLSQMEEYVDNGTIEQDILGEQIIFLKSQVDSQLDKTLTLVDLTRSQVNDLPMDKKLFDIRQVLPGSVVASLEEEIPLLYGDQERLSKALQTIFDESGNGSIEILCMADGLHIRIFGKRMDWLKPDLLLAEKTILLQFGEVTKFDDKTTLILLPWPNLSGLPPEKYNENSGVILNLSIADEEKDEKKNLFGIRVENNIKDLISAANEFEGQNPILLWYPDKASIDEWVKVYGLRHNKKIFRAPIICYSHELIGHNFVELLEQRVRSQKSSPVLFVGAKHTKYGTWATENNSVYIESMAEFDNILGEITPSLIVFEKIDEESIRRIRKNAKTVLVPVLILMDSILSEEEVETICAHPRIILCNKGVAESEQFDARIHGILSGDEILPPHTSAIVKKAILYLNKNASQQIVRWKLADAVHVSEDYLTRIFHKEIGLSLWEYLNRYRIYIATKMLLETNDTIYEIAEKSGFQDQAYFCRVYKKIYGVPPGKIR